MIWGCASSREISDLRSIDTEIRQVLTRLDQEIRSFEGRDNLTREEQQSLDRMRRVRVELQGQLGQAQNWSQLSDEARGRLGEQMIRNLSELQGVNRTLWARSPDPSSAISREWRASSRAVRSDTRWTASAAEDWLASAPRRAATKLACAPFSLRPCSVA